MSDDDFARYVGLTEAEASQLAERSGLRFRAVHPGEAITMEFVPGRVTVTVGEDGRVVGAHRG